MCKQLYYKQMLFSVKKKSADCWLMLIFRVSDLNKPDTEVYTSKWLD